MKHMNMKNKKMWIYIATAVILLFATVFTTYAYLISKTNTKVNEFVPSKVSCEVVESFDGNIKTDVTVKNTGNVNAYIRATVVVNWVDENDPSRVLAKEPIRDTDYSLVFGSSEWVKGKDGFWYYKAPIVPSGVTNNLIERAEVIGTAPNGYKLSVQVLATAIQADPVEVVVEQWGVTAQNVYISPIT